MKKYNALQLKLFMAFLMVLDHLYYIPGLLPSNLVELFHLLTRCVSVYFAYMAIEGFIHTRNRIKYNARLFLWALIMFLGNKWISSLYYTKEIHVNNNIFLTLAIGVLALNIWCYPIKMLKCNKKVIMGIKIICEIITVIIGMIFTEGGLIILPFILISFGFRDKKKIRDRVLFTYGILMFVMSFQFDESWQMTMKMLMFNSDWFFISVIPFLHLYNGERGPKNKFSKYFFYVFYPAHLWIIATIAFLVK